MRIITKNTTLASPLAHLVIPYLMHFDELENFSCLKFLLSFHIYNSYEVALYDYLHLLRRKMMKYQKHFKQSALDTVHEAKEKYVPSKRVDIVRLKMVKESSMLYKYRVIRSSEAGYE